MRCFQDFAELLGCGTAFVCREPHLLSSALYKTESQTCLNSFPAATLEAEVEEEASLLLKGSSSGLF